LFLKIYTSTTALTAQHALLYPAASACVNRVRPQRLLAQLIHQGVRDSRWVFHCPPIRGRSLKSAILSLDYSSTLLGRLITSLCLTTTAYSLGCSYDLAITANMITSCFSNTRASLVHVCWVLKSPQPDTTILLYQRAVEAMARCDVDSSMQTLKQKSMLFSA
jgi:hypothetical protein